MCLKLYIYKLLVINITVQFYQFLLGHYFHYFLLFFLFFVLLTVYQNGFFFRSYMGRKIVFELKRYSSLQKLQISI